eukprot:TRINITY_DN2556_c0_g1_i1.p1 TRINITY_DN2556_c0_g1~~TRINITY_DN2556_c0_g1_i1.p1  ORF type:complete len:259 (+),score=23.01 TRINITY_DN2556_c0_g1_i1:80-856(+)
MAAGICLSVLFTVVSFAFCDTSATTVPVRGWAQTYATDGRFRNHRISILERNQTILTDAEGAFSIPHATVGEQLTLRLESRAYITTTTPTITVPEGGLFDPHVQPTLQVPSVIVYDLFKAVIPRPLDYNCCCQFVVTVAALNHTLHDDPQGEPNATVTISPPLPTPAPGEDADKYTPFYMGYRDGATDPFVRGLKTTSLDGGVLFPNVPVSQEPYIVSAVKQGRTFSRVKMWCRAAGDFVNGSPPEGPRVVAMQTPRV